jgi:hypothetical protein
MPLKKNDKIILIVGVVIIIAAAIGIAAYTSIDSDDLEIPEETENKDFKVSWIKNTETMEFTGTAAKSYNDPFSVDSPMYTVLTQVEINVVWNDDNTYGLLIKRGLDTLTAEIKYNGESQKKSSRGSGDMYYDFSINDMPNLESIESTNYNDALETVRAMFSGENKATFDTTINVDTGERIWRIFNFLRDRGNKFNLEITYHFYTFDIEELEEEEPPTTSYNGACGEFYKNLGYGRGMI